MDESAFVEGHSGLQFNDDMAEPETLVMVEMDRNQSIADQICRDFEWNLRRFSRGDWVVLLDGDIVAVTDNVDDALRALRAVDPDPERGMLFEVHPPVADVIR